jgi:hypothetical protein
MTEAKSLVPAQMTSFQCMKRMGLSLTGKLLHPPVATQEGQDGCGWEGSMAVWPHLPTQLTWVRLLVYIRGQEWEAQFKSPGLWCTNTSLESRTRVIQGSLPAGLGLWGFMAWSGRFELTSFGRLSPQCTKANLFSQKRMTLGSRGWSQWGPWTPQLLCGFVAVSQLPWALHIFLIINFLLGYVCYTAGDSYWQFQIDLYCTLISSPPSSLPLNPLLAPLKTIARGFFVLFHIKYMKPINRIPSP